MRLGLIGTVMHWQTYEPALKTCPGLELAAVAVSGPEETLGAFDHAPGLTVATHRYEDAKQMLEREKLDVVQICARPDRLPTLAQACLERGIPTLCEKPLAMDLKSLEALYKTAQQTSVPLLPMHTQRGEPTWAAVAQAVRAGQIGDVLIGFSQKTYKWGNSRPDYFRSRKTFPGLAPFVGIHAFDWLYYILGDVFATVQGHQSATARPDYTACASQGAYLLTLNNGGVIALTCDYLRPQTAPTHGDERLRLAGTRGLIEASLVEDRATLTTAQQKARNLSLPSTPDLFTAFVRGLRGEGPLPLSRSEGFRITEIALKAQQAADTGRTLSLRSSPFTQPGK
jgi:predicted dehydrogenase